MESPEISDSSKSVKLLYAVSLLDPWDDSEYVVRTNDTLKAYENIGFDIEIITRWGYPQDKGYLVDDIKKVSRENNWQIHLMNDPSGLREYKFDEYITQAEAALRKKITKINPTFVIACNDFHNALPVIKACKKINIPVFYEMREIWALNKQINDEEFMDKSDYQKRIELEIKAANLSDGIISPSVSLKNWLIDKGVPEQKIACVTNVVAKDSIKKIHKRKSLLSKFKKSFIIGYSGPIREYEGLQDLLKSISLLKKSNPRVKVKALIAGEGIYKKTLKSLTKELGIQNQVLFYEKIPSNEMNNFYKEVDLMAFPRKRTAFTELTSSSGPSNAMASGIPFITSDIVSNREYVIHEINGLLYSHDDVDSIHNLLINILNNSIDINEVALSGLKWISSNGTYDASIKKILPFLITRYLCSIGSKKPLDFTPMNQMLNFSLDSFTGEENLFLDILKQLKSIGNSRSSSNVLTCLIRNIGKIAPAIVIKSLISENFIGLKLDYRNIRDLSVIFNRCNMEEINDLANLLKVSSLEQKLILIGFSLRDVTSKDKLKVIFNSGHYNHNLNWPNRHNFEIYTSNSLSKDTQAKGVSKLINQNKENKFDINDFQISSCLFNLTNSINIKNLGALDSDIMIKEFFPLIKDNNDNYDSTKVLGKPDLKKLNTLHKMIFSKYKDHYGPLKSLALESGYLYYLFNKSDVKFNIVFSRRIMKAGFIDLGLEIESNILQFKFDKQLMNKHLIKASKYIVNNKLDYRLVPLKNYKSINKNIDYWQNKLIEMIKFESLSRLDNLDREIELTQRPKYYKYDVGEVIERSKKTQLTMEFEGNVSTVSDAKKTAALMSFQFFDKDYQEIDTNHIDGLSFSNKVGYFSYFNQNNSSGKFLIKFDLPNKCISFLCGVRTWHKPEKFNLLPKISAKVIQVERGEISLESLKNKTIHSKINGEWVESMPKLEIKRKPEKKPSGFLYFTHMALPFESNGYSTRTHGLLTNLKYKNQNFTVQSRYGYPEDKNKLRNLVIDGVDKEYLIDGITYKFDSDVYSGHDSDELSYIHVAARRLLEIVIDNPPSIIQAASNHVNGAIAMTVAKATNTPFIYEVRGLWHMSKVSRISSFYNNREYRSMDAAEIAICNEADMVLAITHAVRYYLIEKGVDESKIYVLPNGVDSKKFIPTDKAKKLQKELNLPSGPVIGYVGSFVRYEGLNLLIKAFSKISKVHENVSLLLVGDGEIQSELENQVDKLGISSRVFFTGRVPHDQVRLYHSLIDIAPFPRTPDIVCEFVSPLKPFESMAMGQVVVASDVAALKEIITDGENGRLFEKGNHESLFLILDKLLNNHEEMLRLKKNGQAWVRKNRDWSQISSYLNDLHNFILKKKDKPLLLGKGEKVNLRDGNIVKIIDRKPNIMAIMDEFSATALEPDANLIRPKIDNYREILANENIDILLVESAWKGNNGNWHRKVGWYSEDEIYELKDLIEKCRDRKIPTIFYNKEDPIHFSRFSRTSMMFDHIFTTDEGSIQRYLELKDSKIKTVNSIQFAAQPEVHNPYNVDISKRKGIAFAGTYYAGKYADRCKKMDMLFDASLNHGLVIYDRQSDGENPQYVFPERFSSNIKSKLEYSEMLKKHKEHLIFLNVNSVENSLTMASRRIFEIPASGACLVSGPGLAMTETYGNIIPIIESQDQAQSTIKSLTEDLDFLKFTIQESRRLVIQKHLNGHRLNSMLSSAGLLIKEKNNLNLMLKISDNSSSLSELYLWLARQNINDINVLIPKKSSLNHELLLENMLSKRGIKFYENDEEIFNAQLEIFDISVLDHNFLGMMRNEHLSTSKEIIYILDDRIIAKIHGDKKLGKNILHHYYPRFDSKLEITSISQINIKKIPKNLILCGHDLKFAKPIISIYEEMGINVMVDQWKNHTSFNKKYSLELLSKADAIWCEWALGNVEWYSKNTPKDIPIFVRYHLQERNYDYIKNSDFSSISAVAFVCKYYEENARNLGQISKKSNSVIIPNILVNNINNNPRNDNYSIGFVGMVPSRKRFDKAIDLLEKLIKKDKRYKLKVVGKMPDEYLWIKDREEEKIYYKEIFDRIEASKEIKENIEFMGFVDDINDFYSSVGHVISTSDFESFHLTLADGPLHGASAHTLPWAGSETIYTELWINKDIDDMSEKIHFLNLTNRVSYHAYQQNHHLINKMQPEKIALNILTALSGGQENDK